MMMMIMMIDDDDDAEYRPTFQLMLIEQRSIQAYPTGIGLPGI